MKTNIHKGERRDMEIERLTFAANEMKRQRDEWALRVREAGE